MAWNFPKMYQRKLIILLKNVYRNSKINVILVFLYEFVEEKYIIYFVFCSGAFLLVICRTIAILIWSILMSSNKIVSYLFDKF